MSPEIRSWFPWEFGKFWFIQFDPCKVRTLAKILVLSQKREIQEWSGQSWVQQGSSLASISTRAPFISKKTLLFQSVFQRSQLPWCRFTPILSPWCLFHVCKPSQCLQGHGTFISFLMHLEVICAHWLRRPKSYHISRRSLLKLAKQFQPDL